MSPETWLIFPISRRPIPQSFFSMKSTRTRRPSTYTGNRIITSSLRERWGVSLPASQRSIFTQRSCNLELKIGVYRFSVASGRRGDQFDRKRNFSFTASRSRIKKRISNHAKVVIYRQEYRMSNVEGRNSI
jgi:hypothetical protein